MKQTPDVGTWGNGYRVVVVPADQIENNPWNPNRQTDETFAKVKLSLQTHGMVELPQVRQLGPKRYQVINGEHRVRAARELGMAEIPVINLGTVADHVAKKLTIITNELRGQPDPVSLSKLIKDLSGDATLADLALELPMSQSELESLSKLTEAFDWNAVEDVLPDAPAAAAKPTLNVGGERKVQVGTVKGSIPVSLCNDLIVEYNRSASAIGSANVESVMRDWVERLRATAGQVDAKITSVEPAKKSPRAAKEAAS